MQSGENDLTIFKNLLLQNYEGHQDRKGSKRQNNS